MYIVRRNVGKTRLTLYKRCKVRRNVKKTRLIQHSIHVRKNVYKRRLIRFELTELTKVRRNVEKSNQTCWLRMHYSREKSCQHTKIQRLIKYATTNLRRNVIEQTNSVRTCVTYERTPNGQTELLQWDNKLRRNVNETTKIALMYG